MVVLCTSTSVLFEFLNLNLIFEKEVVVLCTSAAVLFEFLNLKRDVCIFGLAPAPAWSILQAVSPISKYVFLLRQQAIFSDSLQHQPEMRRYLLMPM